MIEFEDLDWSKPTVIGFVNNPKPCTEYVVFTISMMNHTETAFLPISLVLVFNSDTGLLELGPLYPDDPDYLEWATGKQDIGANLYNSIFYQDVEPYKIRPDLEDYIGEDGQWHWQHYNPTGWVYASNPESVYSQVFLPPQSPPRYTGIRSAYYYIVTPNYISPSIGYIDYIESNAVVEGPMGKLFEYESEMLDWSYTVDEETGRWYSAGHLRWIPWWGTYGRTTVVEPGSSLEFALSRSWYQREIQGAYTSRTTAQVCCVQYVPCDQVWSEVPPAYGPLFTFDDRVVVVHANITMPPGGTDGYDISSQTSDEYIADRISSAISQLYNLNLIPLNEVRRTIISTKIIR